MPDSFRLVEMVKHFTRWFLIFFIAMELLVTGTILWLQAGPRDMGWARGWVLAALNPKDAPYDITIGHVTMDWRDISSLGSLHVSNLQVAKKGGEVFAALDEVDVTIDPLWFLPWHRILHGIEVNSPRLFLLRDEQGVLRFGLDGVEGAMPVAQLTGFFASDDEASDQQRQRLPFRQFSIENATLRYADTASGSEFLSNPLSFHIRRVGRHFSGHLSMPFTFEERVGSIEAELVTVPITYERQLEGTVDRLPSELVCMFIHCPPGREFTGDLSGSFTAERMPGQPIHKATASLSTKNARITMPQWFADPLKLKKAALELSAANNFKDINVESLVLELADTHIGGKATVTRRDDGWYAQGEAQCSRLDMKKLYKYWPLPLAPDSRAWVIGKITEGYAESGHIAFNVVPQDLEEATTRDDMIDATAVARNLSVDYLQGFPLITGVDGTVRFTGKTIHADIDKGGLLTGTRMLDGSSITFTNLDIPATPTVTTLKLAAPANDVATILRQKIFTFDDGLALDPARITGQVDATLKLGFDAFGEGAADEVNLDAVTYDIETTLTNVGQPGLVDGRDISGLGGTLKANAERVTFDGNVKLDGGTDLAVTLRDEGGSTTATAKGALARSQFKQFGIPEIPQLGEGSMAIDAEVKLGKQNTTLTRANIDLTRMEISLPEISWSKPIGSAASVNITPGRDARSYGLAVKAPDLSVSGGSLRFTPAMDDLEQLTIGKLKTSRNDFSLDYTTTAQGYHVALTGAKLDHSDAFAKPSQPGESIFADFPPISLDVDLAELALVKEFPLTQLKGQLRCDRARCTSADIRAQANNATLLASIATVNGVRTLAVNSDNAGDILRAVDLSDRMHGGTLEMRGTYDDTKAPAPFAGRVIISKFKLKNSEILARILSIGSLSGMLNLLTGQGIDFDKLGMNLDAVGGVITVSKGRAESNAIGITLEGMVNLADSLLDLKGVVVPANMINSLLNNVPLIGELLGGEGEGIIAFNYSIKGPAADPKVFVNPLSGLTPGFLRGIFRAGETPVVAPPKEPEPVAAPAPAPEINPRDRVPEAVMPATQ